MRAEGAFGETGCVGVFILMIYLLFACVGATAIIVAVLAFGLSYVLLGLSIVPGWGTIHGMDNIFRATIIGGGLGASAGLVNCVHQLYNSVLPRLSQ